MRITASERTMSPEDASFDDARATGSSSQTGPSPFDRKPAGDLRLLLGVVAPVHQRVAPAGVVDVAVGTLGQVTLHVADDLAHVCVVVLGQLSLPLGQDGEDAPTGLVPGRLFLSVLLLTDFLRLV